MRVDQIIRCAKLFTVSTSRRVILYYYETDGRFRNAAVVCTTSLVVSTGHIMEVDEKGRNEGKTLDVVILSSTVHQEFAHN